MRNGLWLLLLSSPAMAEVTLEQMLAAPYSTPLVRAPRGDRFAWVVEAAGHRSLFVAVAPNYQPRRVGKESDDDGRALGDLSWSGDGSLIAFTRGGDEAHDEAVNVASDLHGGTLEVWVAPLAGGDPYKVADGHLPALSPDGKTLAYVRGGQVHLASGDHFKNDRALTIRGQTQLLRWSPDGSALAIQVDRKNHSYIAIQQKDSLTWMAPEFGYDVSPVFSPEGAQIAFVRLSGKSFVTPNDPPDFHARVPRMEIVVADVKTGQGRVVYRGGREAGWIDFDVDSPVLWAYGRLVFWSEKDGWLRLYAMSPTGGDVWAISPPRCEVHGAQLTFDRKQVIAVSNCADVERLHLATVSLDGGDWSSFLLGNAIQWSPLGLADGRAALLQSSSKDPGAPMIWDGKSSRPLAPPWPSPAQIEAKMVTWRGADAVEVHGQLLSPPDDGRRHPAVIFLHGGPVRQMVPAWHYMGFYHRTYAFNQWLAMNGFVVLSPNYRGGIGYGRAFRRPERLGPLGAIEHNDLVSAARWLRTRDDVDPKRILLWGGSYGGLMTANGLARNSDLFAAGVDFAGLHDWSQFFRDRSEVAKKLSWSSSPVARLGGWRSPVLFIHGDDDNNVDVQQTIDLSERLRDKGGVDVQVLALPDEVHFMLLHRSWLSVLHAAFGFLQRHAN